MASKINFTLQFTSTSPWLYFLLYLAAFVLSFVYVIFDELVFQVQFQFSISAFSFYTCTHAHSYVVMKMQAENLTSETFRSLKFSY